MGLDHIEIAWDDTLEKHLAAVLAAFAAEPTTPLPSSSAEPWMWLQWKKAEEERARGAVQAIRKLLEQSATPVLDLDVLNACDRLKQSIQHDENNRIERHGGKAG
jgi:hypothetical protein